jgi:ribonuclease J
MTSKTDELRFVPLGGTEEIGMNLNLYGFGPPGDEDWVMVDFGITFGDDSTPGIDVILPDPRFIEDRRERLLGIVLTHGHEDHLGAVPYLWHRLRVPVYATPFTAALLRRKLEMDGLKDKVPIEVIPLGAKFSLGPFEMELITLTHSMPEPNAIAIRTPLGLVLHTGDWKFDPDPVIGPTADEAALSAVGDEGVLAAVGDSTNVFVEGTSGSEAALLESLTELIGRCAGKVAVACFASNVARLQTIFEAASANGRAVALVGRSLWRINGAARETGYLTDLPPFLEAEDAEGIPRDQILYICTGSQGEPRAALNRIAAGNHPSLSLGPGDSVIFSSRIIPGNELAIGRLQNRLAVLGVEILTEHDHFVHVSGHPARDELVRMYQHLRPRIVVPVHGEARHIRHHAELARQCQVPETVIAENGAVIRLAPGPAEIVDFVHAGRLALDGTRMVAMDGTVMAQRRKVLFGGSVAVTVILDHDGLVEAEPQVTAVGLVEEDEEAYVDEEIAAAVRDAIDELPAKRARDDEAVKELTRRTVRRLFRDSHGKKPVTTVHVVRV